MLQSAAAKAALGAMPWKLISLAALVMFILGLLLALSMERRQNDKLERQVERCAEARKADRASYERAQADAKAKNLAEVKAIEAKQEGITNEVSRDLNARLERLRRELRAQSAPVGSVAGKPGSSPSGQAPGGANGEAQVCLPASQLLLGAENEERHDQLITWLERQIALPR